MKNMRFVILVLYWICTSDAFWIVIDVYFFFTNPAHRNSCDLDSWRENRSGHGRSLRQNFAHTNRWSVGGLSHRRLFMSSSVRDVWGLEASGEAFEVCGRRRRVKGINLTWR